MTIYIDVLLIFNLYINYFLVRSTALVMRQRVSSMRCLMASAVGALSALAILLPPAPFFINVLIKLVIANAVTFAAFGRQKISDHIVRTLFFLLMCFIYGGAMLALWQFAAPMGMVYENGTAYFNIPIAALAVFTVISYGAIRAIRYFADCRHTCTEPCIVTITVGETHKELKGLPDTGNSLTDVFSGKAVIICSLCAIREIVPENITGYMSGSHDITGIKLIPFRTVGGDGLIPVFSADRITINGNDADALVGVSEADIGSGADCIFNPKIISI